MKKEIYRLLADIVSEKILHTNHMRPMLKYLMNHYKNKEIVGCEVGVDDGKHAFNMLYHLNTTRLYLVDPYVDYPDCPFLRKGVPINPDIVYNEAVCRLKQFNGHAIFIKKFSSNITSDDIKNNSLDYCYIDANHKYGYVKKDIELFYKKVKQGGVLGGHDFNAGAEHGDVARVVLNFVDKYNLELHGDICDWWFIKNKNIG